MGARELGVLSLALDLVNCLVGNLTPTPPVILPYPANGLRPRLWFSLDRGSQQGLASVERCALPGREVFMGYPCTQVLPTPRVYWPPDTPF